MRQCMFCASKYQNTAQVMDQKSYYEKLDIILAKEKLEYSGISKKNTADTPGREIIFNQLTFCGNRFY